MEKCPPDHSQTQGRRTAGLFAAGLVAVVVFAACSGSSDDVAAPPPANQSTPPDTGPDFIPVPDGDTDDAESQSGGDPVVAPSTTEFDLSAQSSTPVIEPIPETGVPGIDSADGFCRAWSEFAGSFQAVGLVSAIGDSGEAYRLEVIAASTVTQAVTTMEANLPAELEAERSALIVDLAGPYFGRAAAAEVDLIDVGIEPLLLRDVWIDALIEAGVDDPQLVVAVPNTVDADDLDAAVSSFSASHVAIVEDPALITDAAIPLTEAYLADVCPDGGTLSGNDVIAN